MYLLGYISSNIFPLINSLLNPIILVLRGKNLRRYAAQLFGIRVTDTRDNRISRFISTSKEFTTFRPSNINAASEAEREPEAT